MLLIDRFPQGDPVLTSAEVRAIEARFSAQEKLPTRVLMQLAGEAAWALLRRCWPDAASVVVLCGRGNNGGDGFVLATLAHQAGLQVRILMPDTGPSSGDAADARQHCPVAVESFNPLALNGADVIVDALLGIGLTGALREPLAAMVADINAFTHATGVPVLALDIPTGLSSDKPGLQGPVLRADQTLSFIAYKPGLLASSSLPFVGTLSCTRLQIGDRCYAESELRAERLAHRHWRSALIAREKNSHKGHFGHLLVVGGAAGMAGAARLCGEAALRCGAGLVSVYGHRETALACHVARPELMAQGFDQQPDLSIVSALIERATVLAVGPGLSQAEWAAELLDVLIASGKPMVLDADALNLLAKQHREVPTAILTPHPREAARLLGGSVDDIEADRLRSAREMLARYKAKAVVLKGAPSWIVSSEYHSILAEGNPAMASGGMGDVLTGIIAALLAQGVEAFDAARFGASLHAWAGDRAAESVGERGVLASDLFAHLPKGLSR